MSGDTTFSTLVREHRLAVGFSQEGLAERASLSVGAIAALEQGLRRAPRRETVAALADALELSGSTREAFEEAALRARGRVRRAEFGIPATLTSFVARGEVDELAELAMDHRIVTITGSGGVGKTRIAIEIGRRLESRYDDTWFVDLLPIKDGIMLAPLIAASLAVPVEGADGLSAIVRRIKTTHSLLIIDNCEHLIGDVAALVGVLARRCSALSVLATSREPLLISGECAYRLPSMSAFEASSLFVQRAYLNERDLPKDAAQRAAIADICHELDGIPLAIELAASRAATLGLEALRTRLKSGLSLVGGRDVPDRHHTMTATIKWSYDLLAEADRLLFRRLSVFAGVFTLDAAEKVCADDALPLGGIADGLTRLAQKSLVNVEPIGLSARYVFLDSIRTFAWETLGENDEVEATMQRLMAWLAERSAAFQAATQPEPAILHADLDNVAGAIAWAKSNGDHATMVRSAWLLRDFRDGWLGPRQTQVRKLAFDLLDELDEEADAELFGLLINSISIYLSDSEILVWCGRAIPMLAATGHREKAAVLHVRCAAAACTQGDAPAAADHLIQGEAFLNDSDGRWPAARLTFLTMAAYVRSVLKDYDGARGLLDGLEIPPGDIMEIMVPYVSAEVDFRSGRIEDAIGRFEALQHKIDGYAGGAERKIIVCGGLARCYFMLGDLQAAERAMNDALRAAVAAQHFNSSSVINIVWYAVHSAANAGHAELAVRLLGVCERDSDIHSISDDVDARERARTSVAALVAREPRLGSFRIGADDHLYELIEEYLAVSDRGASV